MPGPRHEPKRQSGTQRMRRRRRRTDMSPLMAKGAAEIVHRALKAREKHAQLQWKQSGTRVVEIKATLVFQRNGWLRWRNAGSTTA